MSNAGSVVLCLRYYRVWSSLQDGYTVSFDRGQLEMEYEAGQLWMLCNDWTGYEVCQISQTDARKQRVHFILYDKDCCIA